MNAILRKFISLGLSLLFLTLQCVSALSLPALDRSLRVASLTPECVELARPRLVSLLPRLRGSCTFLLSPLPTKGIFNVPLLGLSGTTRKETMTLVPLGNTWFRTAAYRILQLHNANLSRYDKHALVTAQRLLPVPLLLLLLLLRPQPLPVLINSYQA
jgi:hypothetical protein